MNCIIFIVDKILKKDFYKQISQQKMENQTYQQQQLQILTEEHNQIFQTLQLIIDNLEQEYHQSYEILQQNFGNKNKAYKNQRLSSDKINSKLYSVNIGLTHSINEHLKSIMKILEVTKTNNDGRTYIISYHGYAEQKDRSQQVIKKNMILELDAQKFCQQNKFNTQISLYKEQMKESFISKISQACANVYTIRLKSLRPEFEQINEQSQLMKHPRNFLQIEDADIFYLRDFKQLSVIDLQDSIITDNTIQLIKSDFQRLKQLNLNSCYMLTDRALKILAQCQNLVTLEISHMNGLTSAAIMQFIENSNNLNYLDITKNTQIKQDLLYNVHNVFTEHRSTLKWLQITSDYGIDLYINQLSYLTSSNPGEQISDDQLETLIGTHPTAYSGLFFVSCQQLTKKSLENILRKCQISNIKRICFNGFLRLTDSMVQDFTLAMSNIQYLNLSHCYNITDNSLYYISKNLHLKQLILKKCLSITDEGLSHLFINMLRLPSQTSNKKIKNSQSSRQKHPLTVLNLAYCNKITDKSILLLSEYCWNLKSLNISYCEQVTDKSIDTLSESLRFLENINLNYCEGLTDSSISMIATRLPRLKKLEIQWCQVSQKCIRYISENLSNLQVLNLSHCPAVYSEQLVLVAKNVRGLVELRLQSCDQIEENGMMVIGEYLSNLKILCLKECQEAVTDTFVKTLVNNNKNIEILDISWCRKITNMSLFHIAKGCFNLKYLNLNGCVQIDDRGIEWLSATVAPLRYLNLTLCSSLTDKSIISITQNLKDLKIFSLCQLPEITDLGISSMSNLTKLQELQLRGCTHITSVCLIGLLYNLQRLTALDISECRSIEGDSLNKICQFMGNIKVLEISQIQIQDFFLQQLALHCPKLTQLNLCYCNSITDDGILRLIQKLPRLIKLSLQNTNISDKMMRLIAQALNSRKMQKIVIE